MNKNFKLVTSLLISMIFVSPLTVLAVPKMPIDFTSVVRLNEQSRVTSLKLIFGCACNLNDFQKYFNKYKQTGKVDSLYFNRYKTESVRYDDTSGETEIYIIPSSGSACEAYLPLDIDSDDINACISMLNNQETRFYSCIIQ